MAEITNNIIKNRLHPVTRENLYPTLVGFWRDGTTPMSDNLCGGLYNKDTEPTSATFGQYFKWNASGSWPISRLTTINQSNFEKLVSDMGSQKRTLIIDQTLTFSSDYVIPKNIHIRQEGDSLLNLLNCTVTFDGGISSSGGRIFSGSGWPRVKHKVNPIMFGALGDKNADDTIPIQKAFDTMSMNTGNLNPPSPYCNAVEMTTGMYLTTGKISHPVHINLRVVGDVSIWSNHSGVAWNVMNNTTVMPQAYYKEMYASVFSTQSGKFKILQKTFFDINGLNYNTSIPRDAILNGSVGLQVGNDMNSSRFLARYTIKSISIAGFDTALDITPYSNFMGLYDDLHLEGNRNLIRTKSDNGIGSNSGENMRFLNCKFGGADNLILAQADAMDFIFTGCSIDFINVVIKMDTMYRGFNNFKFLACYFERIYDYFIDNRSVSSNYRAPEIYYSDCTGLLGRKEIFRTQGVDGTAATGKGFAVFLEFNYRIDNGDHERNGRELWGTQDPDHFLLVDPAATNISIRTKSVNHGLVMPVLVENNIDDVLPTLNFKYATAGALTDTNDYYIASGKSNIVSQEITGSGRNGSTALKIVGDGDLNAQIILRNYEYIPVNFGEQFVVNIIYKLIPAVSTLTVSVRYYIDEYNEFLELINTTDPNEVTDTCVADTWRCGRWGQSFRITNRKTKYIRLYTRFVNFKGTMFVESLAIDRR